MFSEELFLHDAKQTITKKAIKLSLYDFIEIDLKTKNELISKDLKNENIIKPILRGRDTRKYYCNFHDYFLINSHNGNKKEKVERIDVVNDYPEIYEHLKLFLPKVQKRSDKGDHWTNLRNCAYLNEIEKDKIIYSEIVSEPQFYYDKKKYYPEASAFLITGENLKWLIALLNSELFTKIFKVFYAGGELVGKYRYKKSFLENLPVPKPIEKFNTSIEIIVDYLSFYKELYKDKSKDDILAKFLEAIIDSIVYEIIFEDKVNLAGKEIVIHLGNLRPINDTMSKEEKLAIIQAEFERLYDDRHPVKFAIETLDSIEEVRIIKEA